MGGIHELLLNMGGDMDTEGNSILIPWKGWLVVRESSPLWVLL